MELSRRPECVAGYQDVRRGKVYALRQSTSVVPTSHLETMPKGHLETSTLPSESVGYERYDQEGYDDDVFRILALLWRRRYFVAAFCAVGVVAAALVAFFMANWYTSEVVVQARLPRQDPQRQSDVYLDAASVTQTEVNLIGSREIAEGVVKRL